MVIEREDNFNQKLLHKQSHFSHLIGRLHLYLGVLCVMHGGRLGLDFNHLYNKWEL